MRGRKVREHISTLFLFTPLYSYPWAVVLLSVQRLTPRYDTMLFILSNHSLIPFCITFKSLLSLVLYPSKLFVTTK